MAITEVSTKLLSKFEDKPMLLISLPPLHVARRLIEERLQYCCVRDTEGKGKRGDPASQKYLDDQPRVKMKNQ